MLLFLFVYENELCKFVCRIANIPQLFAIFFMNLIFAHGTLAKKKMKGIEFSYRMLSESVE